MPDNGFGSSLWKNVQAVKLGRDGGLEVPVRANSREGIVIGADAVAASEVSTPAATPARGDRSPGFWRRLFRR
ncbi:hypothetical protein GCM10025782_29350 [Pedococcus ginsenosidimutans]|uniref:Uncharacterized protein n=1 Tax=Pedococcus ginsenosidimutans TaxID=490570 RepID=A0ABP8YIH5_9MICO